MRLLGHPAFVIVAMAQALAPATTAELQARIQAAQEVNDWKQVEATATTLVETTCPPAPKSKDCARALQLERAARLRLADELMNQGEHSQAAAKYLQAVDELQTQAKSGNPDAVRDAKQDADRLLFNAAICLTKEHRLSEALAAYERLFTEYPASPLADRALFQVAVYAEESRDFDKAIERYSALVKDYPRSQHRANAMANRARLLEGAQHLEAAAEAYLAYARAYPAADDAPLLLFHAADVLERLKDYRGEIAALQEFQRKVKGQPRQAELHVAAYQKTCDAYSKLGQEQEARRACEACVAEYRQRGMTTEAVIASRAEAACAARLGSRPSAP